MRKLRNTERGIALLATMLGMILMTAVVMDFTTASMLGFRSAANRANQLRAEYLARSGVNVGMAVLAQDARQQAMQSDQQPHDSLDKLWAQPFPPIAVGGGLAGVSIVDEARKINVNQLVSDQQATRNEVAQILLRLFTVLQVPNPPTLLLAISNWISPVDPASGAAGAAGADYYLRLTPPYAPRNGPMPTIGDLRMVEGVDDVTFNKLSQFLTVIGNGQAQGQVQVNVNTAPPEVLASLHDDLFKNPGLVKEIIQARAEKPYDSQSIQQIGELSGFSAFWEELQPLLTPTSDCFTISGRGTYAGARKTVVAIVNRQQTNPLQVMSWYED